MSERSIEAMLEYHIIAADHLATFASKLTDEELDAPIDGYERSIRATLLHLVDVDWLWRNLIQTGTVPDWSAAPSGSLHSVAEIAAAQRAESKQLLAWYQSASDDSLDREIPVVWPWSPDPDTVIPWRAVAHVVLHGQQHRSEIALALTRLGQSPGHIDLLFLD